MAFRTTVKWDNATYASKPELIKEHDAYLSMQKAKGTTDGVVATIDSLTSARTWKTEVAAFAWSIFVTNLAKRYSHKVITSQEYL